MVRSNVDRQPFGWAEYVYITNQHCTKERFRNSLLPNEFSKAWALQNGIAEWIRLAIPLGTGSWPPPLDDRVEIPYRVASI